MKDIEAGCKISECGSSAAQLIEGTNIVEQKPDGKLSRLSDAFAALLSASAGAGTGWLTWQVTGSVAFGIGIAGPIALLSKNLITNILLKGKR